MTQTVLITTEKKHDYPILIVDKYGKLGGDLAKELKNESLVVYVSKISPDILDNVVHIPFLKKFPTIPDNKYSHIFVIDENAEITKDIMEAFLKKAKNDNSILVFGVALKFANEEAVSNLISSYQNTKIAIFGDIFKKDGIYDNRTDINKFIVQAKSTGKIKIPGDGVRISFPVFFDDVINGILETVFGANDNQKNFYLFPKHGITLLSLAHIFKKIYPDLQVDFVKESISTQENHIFSREGAYLLGDTYNLEQKIRKINFENINVGETDKAEPVIKEKKENNFSFKVIFISIIFFLFLPLISTLILSFCGVSLLYYAKNNIESGNFSSSKKSILLSSGSFNLALLSGTFLKEEISIVGQGGMADNLINNITFGKNISEAGFSLIDASEKIKTVLNGTSKNPTSDFKSASNNIKNALYIYDKEKEKKLIPKSITQSLDDLVNIASTTIDFWPDMAGLYSQKTYMILFQNNMELRPGGGFIGSYGILTFNKGKIMSLKIYDVYDADGQLKGHVEPPYPIRRYLPSIHWFLRDSNFNVDYSRGAIASAVFLNSEMHRTVDGVIGVDLSFVKNILSVLGPINVTDYNQTVSSDNFFQIAQNHTRDNFFPGSTQKKDFLTTFYNFLNQKLSEEKNISYFNLLQALSSSIYDKHVLFAFNNINEQAVFAINGWSSSLIDDRTYSDSTINDFTGINEANLGANKINYYITRSLSQRSVIESNGSVSEILKVTFKNSAPITASGSGIYKNYLRFILPQGTTLTGISIDNIKQNVIPAITDPTVYEKKNFIPPNGLEVQQEDQGPNIIDGFLIIIQPGELRTITIEYTLSQKLNLSNPSLTYSLKIFKQPGIDFYPYSFSLSYPGSIKEAGGDSKVKFQNQKAIFSGQITRDRVVTINFTPQ